ncbi:putative general secretion pathway protein D [Chlamydia pneumoniae LPCoLN]|uniref:secretin N-terminal domain-containing protein n=1 Tax=Chlamydia pneumoniae TaxID=83558 RepID=UPI0001BD9CD1|nr:type II secretion system protein GspD [Chlamydia pneumoniae]ACZ32706.1 putative general secretion pathway protein D [Chlamydia pneumoniae LPCoLN]ETR79584.1 General secretion pathway protein D [Chlamydia pneumoniae B21]
MVFFRNSLLHLVALSGMLCCSSGVALTIAEKMASLEHSGSGADDYEGMASFNANMREYSLQLSKLYEEARKLRASGTEDEALWKDLIRRIGEVRGYLREIEELWAAEIREKGGNLEDYALWNHPETTIYNLVTDYGTEDSIYLIPQEIGAIKIATLSKFVVPKESFEDCLTQILSRLGIGVRQVNSWIKELYMMRKEGCSVAGVFSSRKDLEALPETAYIGFVLNSNVDAHTNQHVLKKFINPETTHVDVIAGRVWIFGSAGEVGELLKIYNFVQSESIRQEYRVIPLTKIDAGEMISILNAAFREDLTKDVSEESLGLRVVPLQYQGRSLFLSGTSALVQQALTLIRELEEGIENPTDKTVFWYNVKHSDPQELAALLSQVHDVFSGENKASVGAADGCGSQLNASIQIDTTVSSSAKDGSVKYGNFIADSKTGTLIMVVEKEVLPRIQMLLKKLDVPKKMVRIEVLLFERKLAHEQKSGLNLLRLGEEVCKKGCSPSVSWAGGTGILEFLFKGSTGSSIVPGYDLAYQFLMAQEDVRINASPSVVTMNQTPARIAVVDEMSIAVSSDKDKAQYNRAQYGIMIKMLPVINVGEEDGKSYITLETDITFDTTGKNHDDRPDVTRRNITNKVRIADGETVIIGGLRCKQMSDSHDGIPFLGDIPGIGKLFGMSSTSDSLTEMFVFITPKILENPVEQQERKEEALLSSRPGEREEYYQALAASEAAARAAHKKLEVFPASGVSLSQVEGQEYDGC